MYCTHLNSPLADTSGPQTTPHLKEPRQELANQRLLRQDSWCLVYGRSPQSVVIFNRIQNGVFFSEVSVTAGLTLLLPPALDLAIGFSVGAAENTTPEIKKTRFGQSTAIKTGQLVSGIREFPPICGYMQQNTER